MNPKICTIYKGSRGDELYLYVAKDSDFSELPKELLSRLGNLKEVMTLALTTDTKLARVQATKVLAEIEKNRYFLQVPPNINPGIFTYGE